MPELPEVETIRRGLTKYILGKKIEAIEVRLRTIMTGEIEKIDGAEVLRIRRFGKGLVIDLDNGLSIAAHVKMTGQFVYQGEETHKNFHPKLGVGGKLPNTWTHVIFKLRSKSGEESVLFYNDIRKFGWLKVIPTHTLESLLFFKNLGPEPFKDLSPKLFLQIIKSSKAPIKTVLMDQRKIAGVGNIYANDALFLARVDPHRSAASLTTEEAHKLFEALLEVLSQGIEHGGASDNTYINVEGGQGTHQQHFLVYGKEGLPCLSCQKPLKRAKQSGRSTFFCPSCQI